MPEWERVRLGDLLIPVSSDRRENVQPDKEYRLLGVRLSNEGPFLRETKKGSDSSASSLFQVREGDFIYSRLFAWRGALGLIPLELDGCYVSNEFPLFTARGERIDLEYLNYWFHLTDVIRSIEADCTGSTPLTRNRYKENFFLALEIPLPPLPEQQRIVTRIKSMLDKITTVRNLRIEVVENYNRLLHVNFQKIIEGCKYEALGDVAPIIKRSVDLKNQKYKEVGARSFGKGLFFKPDFDGSSATWQSPVWIKHGDLVLSNIKAWEGAIAPAGIQHEDVIASHRYITCRPLEGVSDARFLSFYLLTPKGLEQVGAASPGTADRNRTTGIRALRKIPVPVPDFTAQKSFGEMMDRLIAIQNEHHLSQVQFDAVSSSILSRAFAGEL